jgi:elongation factor P
MPSVAEVVSTNQFKNGMHIVVDGATWRIVEFQHVKPGKGGAFVRSRLKRLDTGATVDKTFRAGEKFARVRTEVRKLQFLYDDGSEAHFMDPGSYEQSSLPLSLVGDDLKFVPPSETVDVLYAGGAAVGLQLPASVELEVVEAAPGIRGDTQGTVTKPATLASGAVVQVPLFVSAGERVKVDPRDGRYIGRA